MDNTVYVVVRSTGEYSDRVETPIIYCLTEEHAQEAIRQIAIEAQRDPRPEYKSVSCGGYQFPDGSWLPEDAGFQGQLNASRLGAEWKKYPDAEHRKAQNEIYRREYEEAIAALGHVDPEGSWCGDEYYYAPVTLWEPKEDQTDVIS